MCPAAHEPWAAAKKALILYGGVLYGFLSNCHWPWVSHQSCLSADNEMILKAVHRSPGWGKPQNTSARRPPDKYCARSHCLKWDPLPLNRNMCPFPIGIKIISKSTQIMVAMWILLAKKNSKLFWQDWESNKRFQDLQLLDHICLIVEKINPGKVPREDSKSLNM